MLVGFSALSGRRDKRPHEKFQKPFVTYIGLAFLYPIPTKIEQ